jgi:hypothetical protein
MDLGRLECYMCVLFESMQITDSQLCGVTLTYTVALGLVEVGSGQLNWWGGVETDL